MNSGTEVGGQLAPTASEIQRQVERIAASHGLRNAGPILNVFLYLAKQSLDGAGHAVKEHEIATAALGRPQDFDPRLDSTVRVVVMRLRSRVAEYYIHEGIQDPILIDIPKGSYCLSVTRRVAEELPTSAPEIVAEQADKKARGARRIALAAILAAALVAAYFAGKYEIFTHQPVELRSFWSGLLESGEPLLVFSNPIFQGTPEGGMRLLDPSAFHADGTNDSFTGAGEVMAVHELTEELSALRRRARVKRARLFTWDEALANNLIIVGGPAQSSVSKQLPKLQKFVLKGPAEQPFPGEEAIHDEKAGSGQSFYLAATNGDSGTEYAIVAITQGASPQHWVLILAGTNTYGTEAAARFVCRSHLLQKLYRQLGEDASLHFGSRKGLVPFEALLKVEIRGGVPLEPELVSVYRRTP